MNTWIKVLIPLAFLSLAACEEKGPMEKAGEDIDNAVEDARDNLEDASDEAADKIEEGLEEAAEEVDKAH